MKYRIGLLAILLCAFAAHADKVVTVWDKAENMAVPGASVISSRGIIKGMTDANGTLVVAQTDYPLSIRCIGYEPVTVSFTADTAFMTPASYELAEVTVNPKDRPITRVVTYAREYCTGCTPADTVQLYSEYMEEFFFADGKVKGYDKSDSKPGIRNARHFGRLANSNGLDSLTRPETSDEMLALSFISLVSTVPYDERKESEKMVAGQMSDTIQGKFSPKFISRKFGNIYTVDCDLLADHKEHKFSPWIFKLFGLTMEMQTANWQVAYRANDSHRYNLNDYIYGTCNLHILGKGKLLRRLLGMKDNIDLDFYIEQYPVDVEHLTVDEYKELKKNSKERSIEFVTPANTLPLAPAVQNLVNRIERQLPVKE